MNAISLRPALRQDCSRVPLFHICSCQLVYELQRWFLSILQMRKLKSRKMIWLAQSQLLRKDRQFHSGLPDCEGHVIVPMIPEECIIVVAVVPRRPGLRIHSPSVNAHRARFLRFSTSCRLLIAHLLFVPILYFLIISNTVLQKIGKKISDLQIWTPVFNDFNDCWLEFNVEFRSSHV